MRALLLLVAACYSPVVPEGTVCDSSEHCPSGLTCIDGTCRNDGVAGDARSDGAISDAPLDSTIDAPMIDAMLACTPQGHPCTGGYQLNSCSGLCFVRCPNAVTRDEAIARCAQWSGKLASLDTLAANTCANKADTPLAWIGLTQANGQATPATGWTWANGNALSFLSWAPNTPDDTDGTENGQQQCAGAVGGNWDDTDCGASLGFICQR